MSLQQLARRYACVADLANYFKKKDLLGGLTGLEQAQLRRNIGIVDANGGGDNTSIPSIKYEVFNDILTTSQLVPGKRYKITDFLTIYSSNVISNGVYQTWGSSINSSDLKTIIVTAVTDSRIDPRIIFDDEESKDWYIEYDPTKKVLPDGVTTKGLITFLRDHNNNSAFYDFKSIRFRRTQSELKDTNFKIQSAYIDLYTFSDIDKGNVEDSSNYHNTKNNQLSKGCFNNVLMGDTFNNIFEEDCTGNTFLRGCHDTVIKWNSVNNTFNENVCYTEGSIYNKFISVGNTDFSTSISKTIHKVNDATILSFLDPITYSHQIVIL